MRQRFERQQTTGIIPIADVVIPKNSRHELAPVMAALQYIFVTPELNEQVFALIEPKIKGNKKATGRAGMDMWDILVLAVVRLTLNAGYDALQHHAEFDNLIRQIMGADNHLLHEHKTYGLQTLKDNVSLLDEETINQVNEMVVQAAHQFVLKKNEKLQIKCDTYVFETNVHFPTDLNLLWDSLRKGLDVMKYCVEHYELSGWRKYASWRSGLKAAMRASGKACSSRSKNKDATIKTQVAEYLRQARDAEQKIIQSCLELQALNATDVKLMAILVGLQYFQDMIKKHIDLVDRRLLKGEVIPSSEKVYSIFEPHTEWIYKGKQNKRVELGHKVLVATDQYQFVLHHKVIENQADVDLTLPLAQHLIKTFPNIKSLSVDKGFYSRDNKEAISALAPAIPNLVMPKKGKLNAQEREKESSKRFKKLRNQHSAVESNINSLEHHGLDRCPDKGLHHYQRYVALGILAYNLHRLGNILVGIQLEAYKKEEALKKTALKQELLQAA